jgi:predicted MFS family arabinose efflux permease
MFDPRLAAVAFAGSACFLNLYAPQAVLPLLAQEFAVGPTDISMTMTATTLAVALTAPFTGAVADVLGRKRVITASVALLFIPTAMMAFVSGLYDLLFWRFVQGLLLPPIFAVMVAYVGEEWPPAEATRVTGIYISASSFAGFFGRFLTGIGADTIGWRGAFLVNAALTLACAVAVILLLPRERLFVRATSLAQSGRQMLRHLTNPRLIATYAVGFGVLFNFIAVFTYITFYLAAPPYLLSPSHLGSLFVVYLLGTATSPLVGWGVARLGRRLLVVGLIVIWMGGLLLTLVPWLPAIIAGLAIAVGCGFMSQACATSYVSTTAQQGASSAVGLYATFFYAGGSVGAVVPGFAWTLGGWPATVALVLAVLALMALIVATAWRGHTT